MPQTARSRPLPSPPHNPSRRFVILSLAALLAAAPEAGGAPAPPAGAAAEVGRREGLQRALSQELARAQRESAALGVEVVAIDDGATVFTYNGGEPRVLASNTKLFTTAAALDAFGPDYLFETRFMMRGTAPGGVLAGDLGVVGGGDPQISGRAYGGDSFAVFRGWARQLLARGIRQVAGDLYLDHGLFEPLTVHPDWPRGQLAGWYEAPVSALSFNDNCVLVRVWPGRKGSAVRVETVPPVPIFHISSTARTTSARRHNHINVFRLEDRLLVSGTINQKAGPLETWVTVPDPVRYFGTALVTAFAGEGVEVRGQLRPVTRLPGPVWETVAVYHSDLLDAIRIANKHSQNFYAESLLKLLGVRRCGEGSWRAGVRAVGDFLAGLGVPRGSFTQVDGSGMSRQDRFTPHQVTQLLYHMYHHRWAHEFVQSLPSSGEPDGSLHRRLLSPPYYGNVYAKTGTIEGVSALSGYARAVSGKIYAFSILLNRTRHGPWSARQAQDRLVTALVDHG
jgi:D-alanyl-D-alanine carboxypeptidase/D-alanyl-D-alanine-endopeptidase (penicillin-binding protein 4)